MAKLFVASLFAGVEAGIDCTGAACPSGCACANDKCADVVDACLADTACAQGQTCALACPCNDTACTLKCAAANPSSKALPVATCINSQCQSLEVAGGVLDVTWSDCGTASTHGKISGIDVNTLTLGVETTITGSGTVDIAVTGGTFEMDMKTSLVSPKFNGKICEATTFSLPLNIGSLTWEGMSCPVAVGDVSVPVSVKLSSILPAGVATADIKVTGTSDAGDDLLCMSLHTQKQSALTGADCTGAVCPSACACANDKCADVVDACLADATCAQGQACALACACGDTTCSLKCAAANPSSKALPVATCVNSKCASLEAAGADCTGAVCPSACACANDKCADVVDACLADATCAQGQACALACACGDTTCSLKCAAANPSSKALPVATCVNSKCASLEAAVDCSTAACPAQCECSLDKCADVVNACLADSTCAQGQACALACPCNDTACSLKCAAANPSSKALPVATCINSKCASTQVVV